MSRCADRKKDTTVILINEVCLYIQDVCHYEAKLPFAMMGAMVNPDYTHLALFSGLDPKKMRLINPLLDICAYEPDEIIFEQGDLASFVYILLSGEVQICFKPYDGPPLSVALIQPKGVFGWSAALRRSSYTSGASALVKCEVVRIRGDKLRQLCENHPDVGGSLLERLSGMIAERLNSTHAQMLAILCEGMELSDNIRRRLTIHD
jgi:CRP/FNR family cyclic AMP-dependent transcriptional regulator